MSERMESESVGQSREEKWIYRFVGLTVWFLGVVGMPVLAIKAVYQYGVYGLPLAAVMTVSSMWIMWTLVRGRLWPWR
jgi:hypothetical protein